MHERPHAEEALGPPETPTGHLKLLAEFKGIGATVLRSSVDETKEAALREALAAVQDAAKADPQRA